MKREDFHVGQTLIHLDHNLAHSSSGRGREREVTVVKVGRTNVHVDHGYGRLEAYRMDTGYAVRDFGGRVVTPEERLREQAQRVVRQALREHGLTIGVPGNHYPLETWAAVLELLNKAQADA